MIKLIACDLDGTLLPPSKIMPEETFPLIKKMSEDGVIFVPASGRQLPNLELLFAPVLDEIAIIAENGGLCWHKGKVIYINPTPADGLLYALDIIRSEQGLYPLLSGTDCAYYESGDEQFIDVLYKSYSRAEKVDDLNEVARRETILKISVWDKQPAAEHAANVLIPRIKGLRTKVSGFDWLDVSVATANKGEALNALLSHLNIAKSQSVAFGDHMNDLEMLQASGRGYVTANGFPELKRLVPNIIPSNAENGVITKIKELL
ncbi:MAG: Cof-type HAD-IIB family hydrolase [Clostridia bacterium]|nr:Cof-type HAD-IIB family hydrolase [Clostridia bacterium]